MNVRNYLLLSVASIIFMLSSCDKKRNNSSIATTDHSAEKKCADSILSSITGKTKNITINPKKENKITSKKGIEFLIPANAFVTKNGMRPTGKVHISISEYRTPADILVSKIPMQYKTKDGPVQMESAGMFSITAKERNEELQLASGKDIEVQIPSKNSDVNFNLYYFDPLKNDWIQTMDSLPAIENESQALDKKQTPAQQPTQIPYAGTNVEWSEVEANKRIINGKMITLVKPDCSYKNANFNFSVATDNFPELNLYKEMVWMGSSSIDEKLVAAAFENDQFITASIKERETPLNRYLIAFEFRHTKFNAYMKIASKADVCEVNEEIYLSYYDNRAVDENKIEKINTKIKKNKKKEHIFRSFAINTLGLWNCDRLYVLPEKMIITPRFRSIATGEYYESTTTYMIDKKINSVWTFTNTITLNPDSDNMLLFVNEKGRICYARLNKLSKTHKEKELNLIIDVEELASRPDDTEELDKILNQI